MHGQLLRYSDMKSKKQKDPKAQTVSGTVGILES